MFAPPSRRVLLLPVTLRLPGVRPSSVIAPLKTLPVLRPLV